MIYDPTYLPRSYVGSRFWQSCIYIYFLIHHNVFIKILFDGSFNWLKKIDVLLLLLEGENVVVYTEYSFTLQKTRWLWRVIVVWKGQNKKQGCKEFVIL